MPAIVIDAQANTKRAAIVAAGTKNRSSLHSRCSCVDDPLQGEHGFVDIGAVKQQRSTQLAAAPTAHVDFRWGKNTRRLGPPLGELSDRYRQELITRDRRGRRDFCFV